MINYDKLTTEQKVIADKWEKERLKREELFLLLEEGKITTEQLLAKLEEITPIYCEHNRIIFKHCSECEEIEKIINPLFFTDKKD